MCASYDADTSALIAFLGYIAVRSLDAITARGDQRGVTALDLNAIVAFERIINTSHEEREVLDLQIVLRVNTVVILGNNGQLALAANLKVNVRMDSSRIEGFIGRVNSGAHIVDIVFRILFRLDRNLVTADYGDRVRRITDERKTMKLQLKFVAVANVNDNASSERTRYGIHRFLSNCRERQRCSFELVCLIRAGNTFDYNIRGLALKISIIRSEVVKRFTEGLAVITEIGNLALCSCFGIVWISTAFLCIIAIASTLTTSRKKQNKAE